VHAWKLLGKPPRESGEQAVGDRADAADGEVADDSCLDAPRLLRRVVDLGQDCAGTVE
jgi:hypothetical protein